MRVWLISFLSAISVVALFLIAPSHRGNAEELPQSTPEGPSTAPMDVADAARRIAELAHGSEYNAAIESAGQLGEAVKARLGAHHADYARILYNLADLLTAAGRHAEAVGRYHEAVAIFEELAAADPSNFEWPRYLVFAHERMVEAGDQPAAHAEKALAIVNRLRSQRRLEPWEKDWPAELELKLRRIAAEKLARAGKFADALTMCERWAKQVQLSATAKGTSKSDIADAFGNVAWLALLTRRPATALVASERALALAPDQNWLAINHAHALLFLGRRDAAMAAYLRHKGEVVPDNGKWEAVVGADFAALREHGIVDKHMVEIERALDIVNNPIVVVQRVNVLRGQGRYADALSLIERHTQAVRMQHGEQSLIYAKALDSMVAYASSWGPASRHVEWVAAQRQAIDLFKQFLPRDDPRTTMAKQRLVLLNQGDRDHDAESEALLREVLDTCDRMSRTDPSALTCLRLTSSRLSSLYKDAGRHEDAARLDRWALAAAERKWGVDHPYIVPFLEWLPVEPGSAASQFREGNARIASILDKAVQLDPPDVDYGPDVRGEFAGLVYRYEKEGKKLETEQTLKFMVRKFGNREALLHLIDLLIDRGQVDEAKAAVKPFADMRESKLPVTPYGAKDMANLYMKAARLYGDDPQAASYRQRAFTMYEHLVIDSEPDWVQAAGYLAALADLYVDQHRFDEAAAVLKRAIQLRQNAWATHSPQLGDLRDSLARVDKSLGKEVAPASSNDGAADKGEVRKCGAGELDVVSLLDHWQSRKSEMLARCSIKDWSALNQFADPRYPGWSRDSRRAEELSGIADTYYGRQDWANALALYARTVDLSHHAAGRWDVDPMSARPQRLNRADGYAEFYIRSAYGLAQKESSRAKELADNSFAMAQQTVGSAAASALVQMNFRLAKNEPRLAELLRERQSLVDDWRKLDKALADTILTSSDRRDLNAEEREWTRIGATDARIGDIDRTLAERFPDYADLAQSPPLGIARTQELLRPDEALVLFLEAPDFHLRDVDEAFVWVVTKADVRWVRIERRRTFRGMPLDTKVALLRCGLDSSNWVVGSPAYERCKTLKKTPRENEVSCPSADEDAGVRCFDTTYAYELYQTLFGQVEDLIKDKHLLIVPSKALTQLPFYVLVTEKPEAGRSGKNDLAEIKWLVNRQSVAVLPSVGSLAVLRRMRPTQAHRALIGFGDPLLDGRPDDPAQARRASEARARQSCAPIANVLEWATLQDVPLVGSLFRGQFADVRVLRRQMPLPETTDELCAVARRLGIPASDILLGRRMTEAAVKTLSAEGRLRDYRILHFATHGLVAGDLANVVEPALMFSPPETATELDDGLLTASEVAQLDLDADWVVMSACNTAAGASKSAQALSGLARAFFYAGARALLVSHWAVNSRAAVAITTGAFDAQSADPTIGRAEALRRSIRTLIASGGVNAHPAVWAPFILVGDGT
jgi:CHAT domain-containing protein/tetratricopeptide (TPR) repeat protein